LEPNSAFKFLICFSLPQGHPRSRCLCFHSIFNFDIFFWTNRSCLSVLPRFTSKSMHREVKIKHDL